MNRQRLSILEKKDHLHSEISHEQIIEHIDFIQSCGRGFRGFGSSDVAALAEAFSVMKFDANQIVINKGETGTWFGVLLTGTLKVLLPTAEQERDRATKGVVTISMQPGAVIGEMAVWKEDSIRNASMEGGEPGLIATMLQEDLPQFVQVPGLPTRCQIRCGDGRCRTRIAAVADLCFRLRAGAARGGRQAAAADCGGVALQAHGQPAARARRDDSAARP